MNATKKDLFCKARSWARGSRVAGFGFITLTCLGLVACGGTTAPTGGNALPPPAPPAPPPPPPLSFTPIAGEWVGTVTEDTLRYPVTMALDEAAPPNSKVGTVAYSGVLDCGGTLLALQADRNQYAVREVITFARGIGCVNGATIRLTHDAAAGTLGYRWFNPKSGALRAVATLTRKK